MHNNKRVLLTPPLISSQHVKEKIVCIRSHRERIFRVEHEQYNNKHIFHNYGQAGAGWTFLFGCVATSLAQFLDHARATSLDKSTPIVVVGGGCYGLLTAIELWRTGYKVRIVAKEFTDIPSEKAAGFFFPRPRRRASEQSTAVFQSTGLHSYATYLSIAAGQHTYFTQGARVIPAYYSMEIDPGFAPYIERGMVNTPRQVEVSFGDNTTYQLMEYEVIYVDALAIIRQLRELIAQAGISCMQRTVESLDELDEPIIFNCSGMGAKQLARDNTIIPVQGHLITLCNQPHVDQLQYMINVRVPGINERGIPRNDLIYYAPKQEGILGITFLRGQDSLLINHHEFDRLLNRSRSFFGC